MNEPIEPKLNGDAVESVPTTTAALYRISWKHRITGNHKVGPKQFSRAEADLLVQELNHDYPDIEHEAVLCADAKEGI